MRGITEDKTIAVKVIKQNTKILGLTVLFIVFAILLLVVKSLYSILDYIPTQSVVIILSTVAVLAALGLSLANTASRKAVKKIEEYSNKLSTLLTTTRDIREIVYGDVLLDKIMDSSLKITRADAGSISFVEDDKLVVKMMKGIENSRLLGSSIPKSHSITGLVIENGNIIRVNDVKKDSRFDPKTDNIKGYGIKSVLCAPLKLSSGTIGTLELFNKKDGAFSSEDEELISYFADQASISIARAKFYEDQKNYEIHLTDILLNTIDSHPEKHGHSLRVAKYSLLIANAINLSEDQKKRLHRASLLHDIGFIKMKAVLSKEEYKTHSQIGYEMLQPINFYSDFISIILHHHERYDGKGYPSGLKGEDIPLESRIIAIVEAFDAMVSENSYKYIGEMISDDAKSPLTRFYTAIEELKNNAGTQFDPKLVEAFVNNIDESTL
jgi:putative nucleotidyltransferase with HDIG domain